MSYFDGIKPIAYEGEQSKNPLAFRHYDADKQVLGKSLKEHLRFAVCYWHNFCYNGSDAFSGGTFTRPWSNHTDALIAAENKMDQAFAFMEKLTVPYFTFHDRDVAPEGRSLRESHDIFDPLVDRIEVKMAETNIKLLWGTANLFSHPRYASGAATSPNPEVFAYAAAEVQKALGVTHRLGGENYVLWGGREGYDSLLNTNLSKELDQLGRFLSMVADYKHKIGFNGALLIEPKPQEPTKHQYDYDVATVYGFLQRYGLEKEFKVNIEVNHATLAGHSFEHEVAMAQAFDLFGSIDANRGDPQNGWDTDQFPNSVEEMTLACYEIIKKGGFSHGGFNFDTKLRRQSTGPEDYFYGHIGAMDTVAKGFLNAVTLYEEQELINKVSERYEGWSGVLGQEISEGQHTLASLTDYVLMHDSQPAVNSSAQELYENIVNRYIR